MTKLFCDERCVSAGVAPRDRFSRARSCVARGGAAQAAVVPLFFQVAAFSANPLLGHGRLVAAPLLCGARFVRVRHAWHFVRREAALASARRRLALRARFFAALEKSALAVVRVCAVRCARALVWRARRRVLGRVCPLSLRRRACRWLLACCPLFFAGRTRVLQATLRRFSRGRAGCFCSWAAVLATLV